MVHLLEELISSTSMYMYIIKQHEVSIRKASKKQSNNLQACRPSKGMKIINQMRCVYFGKKHLSFRDSQTFRNVNRSACSGFQKGLTLIPRSPSKQMK